MCSPSPAAFPPCYDHVMWIKPWHGCRSCMSLACFAVCCPAAGHATGHAGLEVLPSLGDNPSQNLWFWLAAEPHLTLYPRWITYGIIESTVCLRNTQSSFSHSTWEAGPHLIQKLPSPPKGSPIISYKVCFTKGNFQQPFPHLAISSTTGKND